MAWNEYRSITEHDTAPNVNWKKRFNLTETYSCGILCFFLPLDLSTYLCACIIITYLLFFSLLKQLWTFAHILFYTGAKPPKTKQNKKPTWSQFSGLWRLTRKLFLEIHLRAMQIEMYRKIDHLQGSSILLINNNSF